MVPAAVLLRSRPRRIVLGYLGDDGEHPAGQRLSALVRRAISDEMLAWNFREEIATWVQDSGFQLRARSRLQRFEWPTRVIEEAVPFFALGRVLESIGNADSEKLLEPYWRWILDRQGSWRKIFFVAGMLLRSEASFPSEQFYNTILRINADPLRSQIRVLFEHFRGR